MIVIALPTCLRFQIDRFQSWYKQQEMRYDEPVDGLSVPLCGRNPRSSCLMDVDLRADLPDELMCEVTAAGDLYARTSEYPSVSVGDRLDWRRLLTAQDLPG